MKTRELIERLQKADPSGELECVVGSEDVYFVAVEPMHYDGRPFLLIHDPELRDKAFSVVGLRYPENGSKVRITPLGRDILYDKPDLPIECSEGRRPYVEEIRRRVKDDIANWDRQDSEEEE